MSLYANDNGVWKRIRTKAKPGIPNRMQLWGWGNNGIGQLGHNDTIARSVPTQVAAHSDHPESWRFITGGLTHSLAIKTDGTLWGWGGNSFGQIGDNTIQPRSTPTRIGTITDWEVISAGGNTSYGIRSNGMLYSWGSNDAGQLGLGLATTTHRSTPTRVGSASNWKIIDAGWWHFFATNSLNQLFCCGLNNDGQLGLGDYTQRNSLTYQGSTTAIQLSLGYKHTIVLAGNGTLWSCGHNGWGELGLNDTIHRINFARIGTDVDWTNISCNGHHNLALKTNGSIWSWGTNDTGQLGLGATNNVFWRSVPINIPSVSDWSDIGGQMHNSYCLKKDGRLFAWGHNEYGQLGQNNTIYRSTAVQVGTESNWRNIFRSGHLSIFALKYE
jgi:alpha-tubulin suppressor-like RCC1 family protein